MIELLILIAMPHFSIQRARRRWTVSHPPETTQISTQSTWSESPSKMTPESPATRRRRRPRSVRTPRLSHTSAIIPDPLAVAPFHAHFPLRYAAHDWQLVYSTMRHGVSLQTFYSNLAGSDPVLVFIRDAGGAVFGCYTSVPWRASKQYYGNGEGFVFSLAPKLQVYKWTRANSFFQLGSMGSIAMGGGGKFAIFLDSMFERGSSGPCDTFDSPCLASSDEFDVVVLEAYKLVSPLKLVMENDRL